MSENVVPFPNTTDIERVLKGLKTGGGSGTFNGMEIRLDHLEKRMDRVEDKLDVLTVMVARIEGKLDAKVDYKWALAITTAIILIMLRAEIFAMIAAIS